MLDPSELYESSADQTQQDEAEQTLSLQDEVNEWKDLAARRAAEVENIRRRTAAEKEQLTRYASEQVLVKLLPVIDDLHNALEAANQTNDVVALKDGLAMIYNKVMKVLESVGVSVIAGEPGEPFDVERHEALMHIPSSEAEGSIVQYIQRGYALHNRVLRHAKVVTSAGEPTETTTGNNG